MPIGLGASDKSGLRGKARQHDILTYVADMAEQLSTLAVDAGQRELARILRRAGAEARKAAQRGT